MVELMVCGLMGSRDSTVVRVLACHQQGLSLNPRPRTIYGLSLLLVLLFDTRVTLLVLQFSSLHKRQHFYTVNAIWSGRTTLMDMSLQIPLIFSFTSASWAFDFYLFIVSLYCTYVCKLLYCVHVDLILFHFFTVSDSLFHFSRINIFWPSSLHMVYTTTLCFKPLCVNLSNYFLVINHCLSWCT